MRIRALLPMACDGVGPSFTCLNLMNGAYRAGYAADMFAIRRRLPAPDVPLHLVLPGPLAILPFRPTAAAASWVLEQWFLRSIGENDVAYLWPAASLEVHQALHDRGVPIVLEGINTRMASARRILDAAYDAFGSAPKHGITDARIEEEEAKYALATTIFAPNACVETALVGSGLEGRFIPTSYGVNASKAYPERRYPARPEILTFMFCGYACVRKGVHHLLDVWHEMPAHARLRLVGNIEPVIAERYRDILGSDRVDIVGFVKDVNPYFASSDVFVMPSLEEGGPQVTYEAALHGLPIVASKMGAGRIGDVPDQMITVDPADRTALLAALVALADSADLRAHLGRAARRVSFEFDWNLVGARRAGLLQNALAL